MQLLLINMEYVGGFQFDNIQFVGKISVCRRQMCLDGSEMLLVDEVDNKEFLASLFNSMYEELPTPKTK